jgi:hypothetical protein
MLFLMTVSHTYWQCKGHYCKKTNTLPLSTTFITLELAGLQFNLPPTLLWLLYSKGRRRATFTPDDRFVQSFLDCDNDFTIAIFYTD